MTEIVPDTTDQLLAFLYTNELPKFDYGTMFQGKRLLFAARRYGIDDLHEATCKVIADCIDSKLGECEHQENPASAIVEILRDNLNMTNESQLLRERILQAMLRNCHRLHKSGEGFIKELVKEYPDLCQEYTTVLMDILKDLV